MVLPSFIITFRETLEAALVVGIVLAYLYKIKQTAYNKLVWAGVAAGVAGSILAAILFRLLAGGFEGRAEQIFEGITLVVAAALISWMILWMLQQKQKLRRDIEQRVQGAIDRGEKIELFLLPFVAVLREGVETVIFLGAISFAGDSIAVGGFIGVLAAAALGYVFFTAAKRLNLKHFFTVTSILLILLAAGLLAHGIHEFQEAGVFPVFVEHVWDINWLVDENGALGDFMKTMFGYNGNPSLLEAVAYVLYIAGVSFLWRRGRAKRAAEGSKV